MWSDKPGDPEDRKTAEGGQPPNRTAAEGDILLQEQYGDQTHERKNSGQKGSLCSCGVLYCLCCVAQWICIQLTHLHILIEYLKWISNRVQIKKCRILCLSCKAIAMAEWSSGQPLQQQTSELSVLCGCVQEQDIGRKGASGTRAQAAYDADMSDWIHPLHLPNLSEHIHCVPGS